MRVAVIGVGMIGELHARIFERNPSSTLVAVCDLDAETVRRVAASSGCSAYGSALSSRRASHDHASIT